MFKHLVFLSLLVAAAQCTSSKRIIKSCPEIRTTPERSFSKELKIETPFEVKDSRPKIFCPENEFLVGYGLLHQESQGMQGTGDVFKAIFTLGYTAADQGLDHTYDDHGVLNVIPYCAKPNWIKRADTSSIYFTECIDSVFSSNHSLHGVRTTEIKFCKPGNVVTGFEFHMQKPQKTFDDAGITNIRFQCQDAVVLEASLGKNGYDPAGSREDPKGFQYCPKGTGICGMESHVELDHHDDNLGLASMRLFCCNFPPEKSEADTCTFEAVWRNPFVYSNCEGNDTTVTFKITAGFSSTKETQNLQRTDVGSTSGQTIGVESESEGQVPFAAKQVLKGRFEQMLSSSTTTANEFQTTMTDIQTGEHSFEQMALVGSKTRLIVMQKVIKCGRYDIKTIIINKKQMPISVEDEFCKK